LAFAVAANPPHAGKDPASSAPAITAPVLQQPSPVLLTVDAKRPQLAALRAALGTGCDLTRVEALAIGGSAGHPEVVTEAMNGCAAVRFTVTSQVGMTLGESAVAVSGTVTTG
jgi:hypothetical protein